MKISRLLEIAKIHYMIGRLVEPRGTNALEAYKEILLIDKYNQIALEGVNEITNYYVQQAQEFWDKGEPPLSLKMVNKGLQASPQHEELLKLQRKISSW